ncbi:MAG: hemerythrin domain-containing protein [Flavobacteriales bacterium]|jgi:iron-sulfur cluster repair protein YtfE (RIC family)|nr:hemerythrin domain-containing protein [Flavobacteriales bacterium]
MPPLERHPLLGPLSQEHHHGLLLCWRIRRDLVEHTDHGRVLEECRAFFRSDLLPHFAVEEEVVFPVLGGAHPLVHRAITEHRRLARLFRQEGDPQTTLSRIEDELEAHIRFEERRLYPAVQEHATAEELERIDRVHGLLMAPFVQ